MNKSLKEDLERIIDEQGFLGRMKQKMFRRNDQAQPDHLKRIQSQTTTPTNQPTISRMPYNARNRPYATKHHAWKPKVPNVQGNQWNQGKDFGIS